MKLVHYDYYEGIKNESLKEDSFKLLLEIDNFKIEECFFNDKYFNFLIYKTNQNYFLPFIMNYVEKENVLKSQSLDVL